MIVWQARACALDMAEFRLGAFDGSRSPLKATVKVPRSTETLVADVARPAFKTESLAGWNAERITPRLFVQALLRFGGRCKPADISRTG